MTIQDFLFFVSNNDFVDEKDFVKKFQTKFPRTISKNKLIGFYKTKDIILMREFYSKVYLIDEVQFFKPKDIDNLVKLADTYGRLIFCYGLLTDANEKLFPASKHLIEVGAKLHELKTTCEMVGCMNSANHHLKYHPSGFIIHDKKSVDVDDGHIVYKSVCRQCYDKEMEKKR